MPRVAPLIPRKMLPPPTTIAISTPRSARAFDASSAMRCTTSESMPKPIARSANASPESFRTTRRYRLSGIDAPLVWSSWSPGRGHAGRTRRALLLADLDAREAPNGGTVPQRLDERCDALLLVLHERLLEQRHLLEEAVQLPVDDLAESRFGLALLARLRLEDGSLPIDLVRRDVLAGDEPRRRARDVERDVMSDVARSSVTAVDAAELDEHADDAPLVLHVLVRVEQAVGRLETGDASELDLLAQRSGQALDEVVDGAALVRLGADVVVTLLDNEAREVGQCALEHVPLGDEVGFAVELDDGSRAALDEHVDRALIGLTAGTLRGTGDALLTQPVLGLVEVTFGFFEGALAIHHPGAGDLAQRRDILGRDISHWRSFPSRPAAPTRRRRPRAVPPPVPAIRRSNRRARPQQP